jgi:5-methylcytosine-specific restriction endonuclease McrA
VRSEIFKRDNYTCQICKRNYPYRYRKRFARSKNLECHHIVPRSLYEQNGYRFDTLENKIKATLEFFHNHNNLRTLCHDCHKSVTSKYRSNKSKTLKQEPRDDLSSLWSEGSVHSFPRNSSSPLHVYKSNRYRIVS